MPISEYSRQKCAQIFKVSKTVRDEPFKECPKEYCRLPKWGHGKVKRLLGTGAGLIFKGSGFYTTDYRSPSYKEGAKKESGSAGDKPGPAKDAPTSPKESPKTADGGKSKKPSAA